MHMCYWRVNRNSWLQVNDEIMMFAVNNWWQFEGTVNCCRWSQPHTSHPINWYTAIAEVYTNLNNCTVLKYSILSSVKVLHSNVQVCLHYYTIIFSKHGINVAGYSVGSSTQNQRWGSVARIDKTYSIPNLFRFATLPFLQRPTLRPALFQICSDLLPSHSFNDQL